MTRNRLCHTRNAKTALRPISANRDTYEGHLNLCIVRTFGQRFPKRSFNSLKEFELGNRHRSHAGTESFWKSFGGGLAQVRATEASDPERRAWSFTEDLIGEHAPTQAQSLNAPSPRAEFARGEAGERGFAVFGKSVRKCFAANTVTSLDGSYD
jgi:hypothetical protein